ncbi:MAG: hypothetical protein ACE5EU_10090, partial [Paracoccaceae bacterium]
MTARRSPRRLAAALALAAAAQAGEPRGLAAEPAEVALALSPDAPSRLVLGYWPSGGWQVRLSGRQAELVLPGAGIAIAAGAVPLPAGGGAITTLAAGTGQGAAYLRIGLGCDCTLAVQGDGERLLIDVVGAGVAVAGSADYPVAPAPRRAPPPPARPAGNAAAAVSDDQRVEETRSRLLEELRRAAAAGLVTLRADADGVLARAGEQPPAPVRGSGLDPVDVPGEAAGLAAAEIDPGQSVVRAATPEAPVLAGTTAPGRPAAPRPVPDAVPEVGNEPQAPPAPPEREPDPVPGPVVDPALGLVAVAPAPVCFGNEAFRLTDPLPADALTAEIGRLRGALVGEFDRINTASALSLARLYLAHGLGVEALGLLADFAPDAPQTDLLAALAWLAEGRPLPEPNILSVAGCTGQHALWQALDAALAGRPAEALEREAAATGALEQTARGLRGGIAVRLGLAAAAEHDWIAVHRLNAMAKRAIAAGDRDSRELRLMLEAKAALGRGDIATGVARLEALRGARSPAGAEALLMLAGLAVDPAHGAVVRRDRLRLDLGAMAMAERDTPLGARAFLAEAELTGYLFGRDAAFELLAYGHAARLISEPAYRDALAAVGASLPDGPGGTPLAVLYEADPERFARSLGDPGFRLALSRSYIGLGAPVLAEALLGPGDLRDEALLGDLARSYLDVGAADAAERLAGRLPQGPARAAIGAEAAPVRSSAATVISPGAVTTGGIASRSTRAQRGREHKRTNFRESRPVMV